MLRLYSHFSLMECEFTLLSQSQSVFSSHTVRHFPVQWNVCAVYNYKRDLNEMPQILTRHPEADVD